MAWRNLWRNRRRTTITVASVFFAVFFALIMRSLQLGSYDHMFRNVIESYTGYIQIQNKDFWDDKTVDNIFEYTSRIEKTVLSNKNVTGLIPRFESFALASTGTLTKGVLVMGIDPVKETLLSNVKGKLVRYRLTDEAIKNLKESELPERVKKLLDDLTGNSYTGDELLMANLGIKEKETGRFLPVIAKYAGFKNSYIKMGESGILVGDKLSHYLNITIGDTLVLIGQGYHGTTAAGKYVVQGIVKVPMPDLDNKIVYLPIDKCQELYNAPGMLTSVTLSVKDDSEKRIIATLSSLVKEIRSPLRVIGWREMNKLLINQMDADNKSGMIMIGILYLVIAFGIFGTVLMMTAERKREFGILIAVGMQKTKLAAIVTLEMLYIGLLGIFSGIAVALPAIIFGYYNPIRMTGATAKMYEDYGVEPVLAFMPVNKYFLWQSAVVAIIVLIAILYPVRKIMKMKVINALKA